MNNALRAELCDFVSVHNTGSPAKSNLGKTHIAEPSKTAFVG